MLRTHVRERLTVAGVARAVAISRRNLQRKFMEYLNRTDFVQVPPDSTQRDRTSQLPPAGSNGHAQPYAGDLSLQKKLELEDIQVKSVVDPELALSQMRAAQLKSLMGDAPFCSSCGSVTVRNGSCYRCTNCGREFTVKIET